ncbi:fimbrial protein [Cupriavidus sp. PET2-C1]
MYDYTSQCAQKDLQNLTIEPLGQVVSGVTYTDGGQTYPVYETNVPGIGYAFGWSFQYNGPWNAVKPGITEIFSGASRALTVYHRVSLVATGRLVAGNYTLSRQTLSTLTATLGDGTSFPKNALFIGSGTLNVATSGCKVTSGATNAVVLPTLLSHSLKAVGAVSDASASFSIAVKCDANVRLYATVTDASAPANTSNTLTLAGNSTAAGVGIQMFRSGETKPLALGPDSSAKGNTNQWYVGRSSASGDTFNIPMDAKYVKTEPTIKPGSVSARSTITFSYQ